MSTVEVVRTYVELKREEFRPAFTPGLDGRVQRVTELAPSFYRFLYTEVGRANHWTDRAAWTDQQILEHFASPRHLFYVFLYHGGPAGYFELVHLDDGGIEINYLGILPEFQCHGLGKHLLSVAVQRCWELGANRVQLDTCTLDHPRALNNYLKRGFRPYLTERFYRELPEEEEAAVARRAVG